MSTPSINSADEIRRILGAACEGRELLFLVTPYVRFESNFLQLEREAVHIRITMGVEEATYALRSPDLHLRFPSGVGFLEGPTKALGFGMLEERRTLRLAIPKSLKDDEQRGTFRVERVGRVDITYSTARYELDGGTLSNLSTTGARITALQDPVVLGIEPGSILRLSIPLSDDLRIEGPAVVRWRNGRGLGLQFDPPLPLSTLEPLNRWVFLKREELLERATRAPMATRPTEGGPPKGVVLLSSQASLEEVLRSGWGDLPPLTRVSPVAQALKDALAQAPLLLIFHLSDASLDTRRRFKGLAEATGTRVPLLLVGTDIPQETLFELGAELKAASVYGLNGPPPPFFYRLLQGMLKRHAPGGMGAS